MTYQVLARKWRPRVFEEIVGQPHVVTALVNALDSKRLHHAYLFTGTRGRLARRRVLGMGLPRPDRPLRRVVARTVDGRVQPLMSS